jgi:signal transduction histidine kinase
MARSSRKKTGDDAVLRVAAGKPPELESPDLDRCLAELVSYYRHSAVGRRCTGVIHNMNTPLQVISFQLELLEQKSQEEALLLTGFNDQMPPEILALHEYRRQKLGQMHQEVDNLREMIHRLALQSVHEGKEEYCYLDLNQIIRDELELYPADPFFKHRVEKKFAFAPGMPPIYGHYIDFSQSLRHLVDNALEAMAESPRRVLTVATSLRTDCRVIRVGDTGVGIPPPAGNSLFQPFFTTKSTPAKSRAGLGLFMTRRLLTPYQAEITIESRPGQTWVTVCIPVAPQNQG